MIGVVSEDFGRQAARVVTRLRAVREARNITQEELARQVGMSRAVLATLETGKRARGLTLEEALTMCAALGVDLCRLVDPEPLEIHTGTIKI